uniref:Potassium channel domain-containing protein n=1 Tax=Rhodosorus marinus TaxID=101924 RepID=A0A7S0FZ65_9RHOD|mmetsp:Transcript_13040/g.18757  ORF Transcript_13040/g.18757 Transcript_13040/m.18757 type:complete len:202 (+) Transcript_13040:272-877(+)
MIIFLITASIYSLEVTAALTNTLSILNAEGDVSWNMLTAVYFIFVTVSTVGYGDIVPTTVLSQVFIILFLMLLVYLVGGKAASLVEAHSSHEEEDIVRSKKASRWGIVCTEKSISALLALNIRFPGAATLVTDIISECTNNTELESNKRQEVAKWQKEFGEGRTNSFFLLEVPTWDLEISFAHLAAALYDVYGLILVAFLP